MRDLLIVLLVLIGSVAALRRPWLGIIVWTWLSLMNPHQYAYGLARALPLSAIVAVFTLTGLLFTAEKESPMKGAPVWWFVVFIGWATVSWLLGLDVSGDWEQWNKVIKIDLMVLVCLALFKSRSQILILTAVTTISLAVLGLKGGFFTLANGGSYRVWGPPGSFIEDNNEFALAMIMTIPLLRFIQLQCSKSEILLKHCLTASMILVALCALGSQSRGGLLAISAMTFVLWTRAKNKMAAAIVLVVVASSLIAFMPSTWTTRMDTIQNYEQDASSIGRLSAWSVAFGIAKDYVAGVGFNPARRDLTDYYSWYPGYGVHAAHSIYFQVLGNHGFIGLFLFVGVFISTWRQAGKIRQITENIPIATWAFDLAGMLQVSLAGYAVGGAFLSLAYFDFPYYLMAITVLTKQWVNREAWLKDEPLKPGWRSFLGLQDTRSGSRQNA